MLTSKEFSLFQSYIKKSCGIIINEDKSYLIESRLIRLLVDYGFETFEELYSMIEANKDPLLAEKVIEEMTTNETLWFRDKTPWKIMDELLLPRLVDQVRKKEISKVRLWSAASSTGQEAYSTVMAINEHLEKNNIADVKLSDFEIIATDISRQVIEIAKKGRYDPISMRRGIDEYYKNKYFEKDGNIWKIKENIKNVVKFQKLNLQNTFVSMGKFDIIFCRYVMIYFSQEFKNDLLEKLYKSLNGDGAMFIGSSELLYNNKHFFDENEYKQGIYYTKKILEV